MPSVAAMGHLLWPKGATMWSSSKRMQDLADVREMERMRAEFLLMVSHELRAPFATINQVLTLDGLFSNSEHRQCV